MKFFELRHSPYSFVKINIIVFAGTNGTFSLDLNLQNRNLSTLIYKKKEYLGPDLGFILHEIWHILS